MKTESSYPEKKGKINIFPEIENGNSIGVVIVGDKTGLKYLAELLIWLAEYDQESSSYPDGTREHIHLHRNEQLDDFSCEVELCRADAKGTGEMPDFMK